ncbi:DUF29 domain-containing protein [Dactylococcopsis salina]|uniref:DUF29 domain-containing protein n=1 Tax=Dactylococcopsis salina (strain PCC 8305) TaxID=13035 RepID=K9YQ45_DACS8|nr:DUF29 domain-containing protein [Dactylococcopsis salina]AFZ49051.1 protein of unknown function DUF29 [Dactylococcopsis salina PCC 8305]
MVADSPQAQKTLYETDYHLWVVETVKKLQNREFETIDWEDLIDEVSDLSRREKQKLKSLLKRLVEHLLKLKYWESQVKENEAHWKREILNFRQQLQEILADSPSLKPYIKEVYPECYQKGRKLASTASGLPLASFPESAMSLCDCPKDIAPLETILDENWLP